jgi:metal-dependent amidase/aminoacylase/carboxypeptidase family protein
MTVRYTGKAAHAAASPWEGLNALDAAVLYQTLNYLSFQSFDFDRT